MRKNVFLKSAITVFVLTLSSITVTPVAANAAPNGSCNVGEFSLGNGSAGAPYRVANAADLAEAADCGDLGYSFLQTANISLTGSWNNQVTFAYSTFDGQNFEISDLLIDGDESSKGLFSSVNNSIIQNLKVSGVVQNVISESALLAGYVNASTVSNVEIVTDITLSNSHQYKTVSAVGGAFGLAYDSEFVGITVSGLTENSIIEGDSQIGGVAGNVINTSVLQSFSSIDIHLVNNNDGNDDFVEDYAGGLIGDAGANTDPPIIQDSGSSGDVTCDGDADICGGLVGSTVIPIVDSYATGDVVGDGAVGGLAGFTSADISNSYSQGSVTARNDGAGGLIGVTYFMQPVEFANNFASGEIFGKTFSGGLIGYLTFDSGSLAIENTYAIGNVNIVASDGSGGGFFGEVSAYGNNNALDISNSYFGGNFSAIGSFDGVGSGSFSGIQLSVEQYFWTKDSRNVTSADLGSSNAKPVTLFKRYSTFSDESWDLQSVWKLDRNFQSGYLSLRGVGTSTEVINAQPTCVKVSLATISFKKNSVSFTNASRESMRQNSLRIINSNCGSVKIYGYSSNDETKKKQKSLASRRAKAVADFVRGQLEQNSLFIEITPVGKGVIKKGKVAKNRKATATIIN
ncbi:MAG: hypothetical protein RLZZ508_243 [Actinomycetota bacterium]|jgi:outer membrane protein OmpA-like peptidoglycan-associated protein